MQQLWHATDWHCSSQHAVRNCEVAAHSDPAHLGQGCFQQTRKPSLLLLVSNSCPSELCASCCLGMHKREFPQQQKSFSSAHQSKSSAAESSVNVAVLLVDLLSVCDSRYPALYQDAAPAVRCCALAVQADGHPCCFSAFPKAAQMLSWAAENHPSQKH